MPRFDLTAGIRHTTAAIMLERFLDDNAHHLPPNMFDELNDLAGEIETVEDNYNTEIQELKEEKEQLEQEKEELEKELKIWLEAEAFEHGNG